MSNEEYMTMMTTGGKETKISIGGLSVPSGSIRVGVGGMKLSNVSQNQAYLNV